MSLIREWGAQWNMPLAALLDLEQRMGLEGTAGAANDGPVQHSEAYAQSQVVLEAPKFGCRLWRNNVGAFKDESGAWVRYGLANESKKMNERIKSSDLIGPRTVIITPAMVGFKFAKFTAREIKYPGWTYSGTPHEVAQLKYIQLVNSMGGDAAFATGPGSFK